MSAARGIAARVVSLEAGQTGSGADVQGRGANASRPLLSRERLLDWAPQPDGAWATIVGAPAGYGKTICLRAIAAHLAAEGRRVFWATPGFVSLKAALAEALGAAEGAPLLFVVDDIDRWPDATGFILGLGQSRPETVTLLAARRERLGPGVARLQVNGEVREMTAADLRFTDEEALQFMLAAGLVLDPVVRGELLRITEGWPAALQLALPRRDQRIRSGADLVRWLARPTGPLGAYLDDEMIGRTPPELRRYVLEAGALGRFTAGLLEDAIGCKDGKLMIRRLDDAAFFLTVDEGADRWRRFHPLVSAFLEARLRSETPARSREIHVKAAAWHEQRGHLAEAITHAFASQDVDLGVRLLALASGARERIGRWRAFTQWTSRLNDEVLERYPAIRIEAACAHAVLFEFEAAKSLLEAVRGDTTALTPQMADELLAADAVYASFADHPDAALEAGERGLSAVKAADPYVLGCLRLASGVGWIGCGDLDRARGELQVARATYENGRSAFGVAMAHSLSGLSAAIEGHLDRALAAWREGEAAVRPLDTVAAVESVAVGYTPIVLYEHDRLDAVDGYIAKCFASTAEVMLPDMVTALYVAATRTAFARGEHDRAAQYLDDAEVAGLRRKWSRLCCVAASERLTLALRRQDWAEAARLRRALDATLASAPAGPKGMDLEGEGLAQWRFLAMTNPSRALLGDLRTAFARASAQNRIWRAIRLLMLEAVTRKGMGDQSGALRTMTRAIGLGAPKGFVRAFVDEGPGAVQLLKILAEQEAQTPSPSPVDFTALLAAAGEMAPDLAAPPPPEDLSRREIEVLQMVAAGLSNRELATRLAVSENTVKWHLQHVFAKLGVKNRTRAVIVARHHGLVR